ncbi:transglutaminase domain-containing protein [Larkinella terrae]|uniref:Kyphoscoliosis peptidase n=1 Tax=Larkinella terrae TaxID=2025311 RepID=A0A7K0ELW7_9BACT|nr:transglutaminase domain-containing protein [Larkinella terrae]MRS62521.1 Kyphoscoliosis peptidase [Larkinella terrae]
MCRRFLPIVLVLVFCVGLKPAVVVSPSDNYGRIDSYARNAPDSYSRNIATLSDYLTGPARTDMDKVRVIYAWMVSHIRYDQEAVSNRSSQRYYSELEYANRVLRQRKGLCTGYALLFKYLLKRAGIESVNIRGYARTEDKEAGNPIKLVDHEWNAVNIEDEWYLLDLAWAVTTAPTGEASNDFYFLTPPELFISQHFPTETRWQFLDQPLNKGEFDRFPKLYDPYFQLGFGPGFPRDGQLRVQGRAALTLQNEQSLEYLCTVSRFGQSKGSEVPVSVSRYGNQHQLQVNVPIRGWSTLHIFARSRTNARVKKYDCIASFSVYNS